MKLIISCIICLVPLFLDAQIISTFAGNGFSVNNGDGGPSTAASLNYPTGGTFNKAGDFYFTTGIGGNSVRKISSFGVITTVAGNGNAGFSGDDGQATAAELNNAQTVAVDARGNLFVGDVFNNRIRRIDISTGVISTFAGTGVSSFNGDGLTATATNIQPNNLCFDNHGNLFFNDVANYRIRKISGAGIVTTVAGNGTIGFGGDGVAATSVSIYPNGIFVDKFDNLYFADDYARVYRVNSSGMISFFAGTGISGDDGDGGPANAAKIRPTYITVDDFGNLFISQLALHKIRLVNTAGYISTIAGNGQPFSTGDGGASHLAQINYPGGITLDSCGNLYISESHGFRIRKITYPKCHYLETENLPQVSSQISIYPNPSNDILHIDNLQTKAAYRMISMVGAVLQQGGLKEGNNVIDITALPVGMYLVELSSAAVGLRMMYKIVKQ